MNLNTIETDVDIQNRLWSANSPPMQFSSGSMSVEEQIKTFPSTRYYGSKKRLLGWFYDTFKNVQFNSVLDGFGGTASVSLLFKAMGKKVYFNDALLCNGISARALLADQLPFSNHIEVLQYFEHIRPKQGLISRSFSGKFYEDAENAWLDGAVQTIYQESAEKRNALLHCLFQACLQKRPFNLFHRANLNLRTSRSHKQSFGNQTTWDTPFPVLAHRAYMELDLCNWHGEHKASILPPGDIQDIPPNYDLVYFDPPYLGDRYGDDYLRRYHFLEGLSQYNIWENQIDKKYNNLQFKRKNHITNWQRKQYFESQLYSLIEKHRRSIVALSYLDNTYPSKEMLTEIFARFFNSFEVVENKLTHVLSKGEKTELLFIGLP